MGKMYLALDFERSANAMADGGRAPFTDPVQGKNRSAFKRRGEEGTCSMRLVVFRKQQRPIPVSCAHLLTQFLSQQGFLEQLFLRPDRHCGLKRAKPAWDRCQIRFKKPFKLQKRLVVENDVVDIAQIAATLFQAISNGVVGKARIVLEPGEPFFLRGSYGLTTLH
jgi:hypothetical protein